MTKADLIKALAPFPDETPIIVELDSEDGDRSKTLQADKLFVGTGADTRLQILIHNDENYAAK